MSISFTLQLLTELWRHQSMHCTMEMKPRQLSLISHSNGWHRKRISSILISYITLYNNNSVVGYFVATAMAGLSGSPILGSTPSQPARKQHYEMQQNENIALFQIWFQVCIHDFIITSFGARWLYIGVNTVLVFQWQTRIGSALHWTCLQSDCVRLWDLQHAQSPSFLGI